MRKILIKTLIVLSLCIVLIVIGSYVWLQKYINERAVTGGTGQALDLHFKQNEAINILFLGYGGGSHDGALLTDTMQIAHIDLKRKNVTYISIPRDLWVRIPTRGLMGDYWKINAAYSIGANDTDFPEKLAIFKGKSGPSELAKYVITEVTGLKIDRFIAVDFTSFTRIIDAIGGVDVKVDTSFDDFEYPKDGYENNTCGLSGVDFIQAQALATTSAVTAFPCRYEHIHFDKGVLHMDGALALKYVRSRHSLEDGSDFARSKRQKNVLDAIKSKLLNPAVLLKIPALFFAIKDGIQSDFSFEDLQSATQLVPELKTFTTKPALQLDGSVLKDAVSNDGQAILIPLQGVGEWENIRSWIASNIEK